MTSISLFASATALPASSARARPRAPLPGRLETRSTPAGVATRRAPGPRARAPRAVAGRGALAGLHLGARPDTESRTPAGDTLDLLEQQRVVAAGGERGHDSRPGSAPTTSRVLRPMDRSSRGWRSVFTQPAVKLEVVGGSRRREERRGGSRPPGRALRRGPGRRLPESLTEAHWRLRRDSARSPSWAATLRATPIRRLGQPWPPVREGKQRATRRSAIDGAWPPTLARPNKPPRRSSSGSRPARGGGCRRLAVPPCTAAVSPAHRRRTPQRKSTRGEHRGGAPPDGVPEEEARRRPRRPSAAPHRRASRVQSPGPAIHPQSRRSPPPPAPRSPPRLERARGSPGRPPAAPETGATKRSALDGIEPRGRAWTDTRARGPPTPGRPRPGRHEGSPSRV